MRTCLDCDELIVGGSRCEEHRLARENGRQRGTPAERGYDREWARLSRAARREQPWCSECGGTRDLTADHIVPLARGGASTRGNVRVLCRSCNGRKAARMVAV